MHALNQAKLEYTGGKNAPYIWMKCPDGLSGWDTFDLLLEKAQIVGTPGEGFGRCGTGFFRFSMFAKPEDIQEAGIRIKSVFR